jgi:starch-binding outer membrane protein, SusD/RagB family
MMFIGVFLSCSDLEEKPLGLLSPEGFFKTPKDVETAIFGAYGWIASENCTADSLPLHCNSEVTWWILETEVLQLKGSKSMISIWTITMVWSSNFWPYWYQVISAANSAIAGAETLTADAAEVNPLIAEARFVRAFSYYHLVRVFGDIPYIDYFISAS